MDDRVYPVIENSAIRQNTPKMLFNKRRHSQHSVLDSEVSSSLVAEEMNIFPNITATDRALNSTSDGFMISGNNRQQPNQHGVNTPNCMPQNKHSNTPRKLFLEKDFKKELTRVMANIGSGQYHNHQN